MTTKTLTQIDAAYYHSLATAPINTRCQNCHWTHTGTAQEGQEQFRKHLAEDHPEIRPVKRRRTGFSIRVAVRARARERAAEGRPG